MFARNLVVVLPLIVATASIANFARSGDCSIIVSSRQMLKDAFAQIRDTATDAVAIYTANNDWFAISPGTAADAGLTDFLASLVGRRAIPPDSYCST